MRCYAAPPETFAIQREELYGHLPFYLVAEGSYTLNFNSYVLGNQQSHVEVWVSHEANTESIAQDMYEGEVLESTPVG